MWIVSARFDLLCIIAPGLFSAFLLALCPEWFSSHSAVSPAAWVALVLCVDVAHVYTTLFRTYFDAEEFAKRRTLYIFAPIAAWVFGVLLYTQGALWYWRVAAYLAVFHFIRQQYGFMMIYRNREGRSDSAIWDKVLVYLATLYPVVFWHTHPREFSWFVENDFLAFNAPGLSRVVGFAYLAILLRYLLQEGRHLALGGKFHVGKNLFLCSTICSWYLGIVVFNGDLAFTLTNVLSHGIPYIALVWVYQQKKPAPQPSFSTSPTVRKLIQPRSLWVYILVILVFAYCEEALWDLFVWKEHRGIFPHFGGDGPHFDGLLLSLLVPLLSVPQLTHYILDGFIWKIRKPDPSFAPLIVPASQPQG